MPEAARIQYMYLPAWWGTRVLGHLGAVISSTWNNWVHHRYSRHMPLLNADTSYAAACW